MTTKHVQNLPIVQPVQTVQPALASPVVRAGLSGAALAGTWTGIYEILRVRNGEVTTDEAVRTTFNSAAIGAGAGVAAHVVSGVARSMPILGLAVLAAGVLFVGSKAKVKAGQAGG